MSDEARAPGWYPDERYPEDERWWDGASWTASRPRGEQSARPRSMAEVEEERHTQRVRRISLIAIPVGIAIVYALWALVSRL